MTRYLLLLSQAMKAMTAFKLRLVFCSLSVALGIAAVTIIVAATEGAHHRAITMVERFGPDSVLILGGSEESRAVGRREHTLTLGDAEVIREAFPTAYLVVAMSSVGDTPVSYRAQKHRTRIIGSTHDYSRAWSWPVEQGSDISQADVQGSRNVALVGQQLRNTLFKDEEPIGKYLLVGRIPVQVVGVLSERGASGGGHNLDDRLIMPLSTVMKKLLNERTYVSAIRVRFFHTRHLDRQVEELRNFLRLRHNLPEGLPDDFRIISPGEIIRFLVAFTGSLVVFIGVAGITCLVVAGFVLANLFLLSVKERVGEIGIRRSVGARRLDIRFQFLGEAVFITSAGGVLGLGLGVLLSYVLSHWMDFPVHFSWKAFVVGMILSWIVGVLSGLQPANRAAVLAPVEAIRS